MKKTILAAAALSALASPAFATAKLTCSLDDATMKLSVESGVSTNGERLFDFRGAFVLKDASVPEALRSNRLDRKNLMQGWLDRKDLRLRIFTEAGKGGASAELVILTTAAANGYDGTYALTIRRGSEDPAATKTGGNVRCTVG